LLPVGCLGHSRGCPLLQGRLSRLANSEMETHRLAFSRDRDNGRSARGGAK
jgi:hypothetical protein